MKRCDMANWFEASGFRIARSCARFVLFLCIFSAAFGVAMERASARHSQAAGHGVEVTVNPSDPGTASEPSNSKSAIADHGCHCCAFSAIVQPGFNVWPAIVGAAPTWSSLTSSAGREPLIDLPPPRA